MMDRIIDIRSDTVTQPTPEMRRAMAEAPVGDDVYGDDPTVNRLEQLAAEFSVICGRNAHVLVHEVGASAVLSGVTLDPVDSPDDIIHPHLLEKAIREDDLHCPPTTLLCVENALATGRVVPLEEMEAIYTAAKARGLMVHMDGARLCAPVGSMLAGSREFITRARKNRKILGGAMRQCGILAAAGILALTEMPGQLETDHQNAAWLRQRIAKIPGVQVKAPGAGDQDQRRLRRGVPLRHQPRRHPGGPGLRGRLPGGSACMKKLYDFLGIAAWSFVGVFLGSSIYTFYDYKTHPGLYAMQSAPWYLSIQVRAVFTLALVAAVLLLRWYLRKKMDQGDRDE